MIESHTIMDGKVHVYRRERSRFWQCAVFLSDRNFRQTTRQENAAPAIDLPAIATSTGGGGSNAVAGHDACLAKCSGRATALADA